jgi:magnesium-transporting ATPase (P-type)
VSDHSLDQLAAMSPLEVCAALQTAPHGLDEAEARKRRERYGPNAIADTLPISTFRRLAASFINWISLILLIAGLLAFLSDTPVRSSTVFSLHGRNIWLNAPSLRSVSCCLPLRMCAVPGRCARFQRRMLSPAIFCR